jgi:hypothetical protein
MDIKGLIYKTRFTLPHVGFLLNLNYWNSGETWKVMTMGFSELLGALLVWGTGFYAYTKIRKSYAIYCLASAILFTFQAKWQSIFRYCFVLFPIFIMMVQISKKGWIRDLLIGLSLIFLALLCMQYARGHWAF